MNDQTTVTQPPVSAPAVATTPPAPVVTEPKNQTSDAQNFDPSKISNEDFGKIFDDPRLFQHSRFKELNDQAKKARDIEAAEALKQEEELKKKGEFEKLTQQKEQTISELKNQIKTERLNNALLAASSKLGVIDAEAVLKLVDRNAITIDETTGAVTGVEEALNTLITAKPYLAGKAPTTKLGTPSNPTNQNTGELKRFKLSEIQNAEFYRTNEKDILASMKANLIEDDITQ